MTLLQLMEDLGRAHNTWRRLALTGAALSTAIGSLLFAPSDAEASGSGGVECSGVTVSVTNGSPTDYVLRISSSAKVKGDAKLLGVHYSVSASEKIGFTGSNETETRGSNATYTRRYPHDFVNYALKASQEGAIIEGGDEVIGVQDKFEIGKERSLTPPSVNCTIAIELPYILRPPTEGPTSA